MLLPPKSIRKGDLRAALAPTLEETGKQLEGLQQLIEGQEKLGVPPADLKEARDILETIRRTRQGLIDGLAD
jgi:hypothetical protein